MAQQTIPPQHPMRQSPVQTQVWTVWTMFMWFLNNVYDPQMSHIGGGGGDANFVFTQVSASNTWSVAHNLGKYPAVNVVDSGGTELVPDVLYVDSNHVTVTFAAPTSGKVYCN